MKKYLPLGSVVVLNGGSKKLMIIGRCQICQDVTYDYSACLFPEGYLNKDSLYIFNNEDIEELYYVGMQDEEEFTFRKALIEAEENARNKTEE